MFAQQLTSSVTDTLFEILGLVGAQRQRLIDDVDKKPNDDDDDLVDLTQAEDTAPKHGPSNEAMAKITDYSEFYCFVLLMVNLLILL